MPLTDNSTSKSVGKKPNAIHHPDEDEFVPETGEEARYALINEIEHYLRAAIISSKENPISECKRVINWKIEHDLQNYFGPLEEIVHIAERRETISDQFLTQLADETNEHILNALQHEAKKFSQRMHWFEEMPSTLADKHNLGKQFIRKSTNPKDGIFTVKTVVSESQVNGDLKDYHLPLNDTITNGPSLEDLGFEPPITVIVCVSPDSGNKYPLFPWYGTLSCQCPYKHNNPTSTICKHEMAGLILYRIDEFRDLNRHPSKQTLPWRHNRLIRGDAFTRFTNEIKPSYNSIVGTVDTTKGDITKYVDQYRSTTNP